MGQTKLPKGGVFETMVGLIASLALGGFTLAVQRGDGEYEAGTAHTLEGAVRVEALPPGAHVLFCTFIHVWGEERRRACERSPLHSTYVIITTSFITSFGIWEMQIRFIKLYH